MERKIKLVHVGSLITLRAIQKHLDDENIPSMVKDIVESGRLAGFGTSNSADELYVFERDFDQAKKVIEEFSNKK